MLWVMLGGNTLILLWHNWVDLLPSSLKWLLAGFCSSLAIGWGPPSVLRHMGPYISQLTTWLLASSEGTSKRIRQDELGVGDYGLLPRGKKRHTPAGCKCCWLITSPLFRGTPASSDWWLGEGMCQYKGLDHWLSFPTWGFSERPFQCGVDWGLSFNCPFS